MTSNKEPMMSHKRRSSATGVLIFIVGGGVAMLILLGLAATFFSIPSLSQQQSLRQKTLGAFPLPTTSALPTATVAPAPKSGLIDPTFPVSHLTYSATPFTSTVASSTPGPFGGLEFPPRGQIVFTCTPEGYNQLCLMNADGSNYIRLTNHKANDYYPSLARDGQSIFFVSNRSFQFEVYVTKTDGSDLRQLTHQIGNVTAPELSPNGRQIVFALKKDGDSSIWLAGADGSTPHPITDDQWDEIDPTWSPDGQRIAFAAVRGGYVELFSMKPDGSDIRQETQGVYGIGGRSSWSPDGTKLVFYAGPKDDRDIYVVEIVTGQITRLTRGGNNTGPCFSPDGHWISFSSSRDGDHEIYIMQADGSHVTQLTENSYDDWQPRWGP